MTYCVKQKCRACRLELVWPNVVDDLEEFCSIQCLSKYVIDRLDYLTNAVDHLDRGLNPEIYG